MKKNSAPVVSIIGRPNVGKSSLFNRICGRRHAVVFEKEGTTRDRIERRIESGGKAFILVDTGGFPGREKDEMSVMIKREIQKAIGLSDVLLFVCDGEKGLLPLDAELGQVVRKSGKRIILVVNKIDNEKKSEGLYDFYELGLGEIFAISCTQNLGMDNLLREITLAVPERPHTALPERQPIKIAIVGRPNVGKSSFLNTILAEERALVHDEPGTTRDAIDTYFESDGIAFLLVDTAGMRHARKVKKAVEVYSMMRARDSIDHSDVALLLIDGMEGLTSDDINIFSYIRKKGKGSAILVNKWDLVKGIETQTYKKAILRRRPEARNFPIEFISAKTGRNALKAFRLVGAIKTNLDLLISKAALRDFLKEVRPGNISLPRNRKAPKFYYMAQLRLSPKEFLVFVNDPKRVSAPHTSFIENRLRERFPLAGVPIAIKYKKVKRS